MNLLRETLEYLEDHSKTPKDILWVGTSDGNYAISFEAFRLIANFEYDDGFGGQEIPNDLVIVGEDWWMDRSEYDGSERWDFNNRPVKHDDAKGFTKIPTGCWDGLEYLLNEEEQ